MPFGENPIVKKNQDKKLAKFCETCGREMKQRNRCEYPHVSGTPKEPCYYCHLMNNHITVESSQKKNPKKKT